LEGFAADVDRWSRRDTATLVGTRRVEGAATVGSEGGAMGRRGKTWPCRRAVGDAERILAGRCVDHYRQYGMSPPPWAVVNDLAHGTLAALTKQATGRIMWRRSHPWESAERDLAAVLVSTASPEEILCVQQEVLVPLELALLDNPGVYPATPAELVDMVTKAVGRVRNGYGS
jgi:hypothetical protein